MEVSPGAIRRSVAVLVFAIGLAPWLGACGRLEPAVCAATQAPFSGEGPGFELVDLWGRKVWGTRDWTPGRFEAFALPVTWLFWRKNDTRVLWADRGRILRSPGCAEDGQYTRLTMFGREFVQVVSLVSVNSNADRQGLIRRVELIKHHRLTYDAGSIASILTSPAGERFIGVARTLARETDMPTLPERWSLSVHTLSRPLQVDLIGPVSVLRTDNADSFQGPLPDDMVLR